eukprot:ctg_6843.g463
MATVSPALTLAVLITAPMPVVTPHPSRQTFSSGASLGDLGHGDFRQHGVLGKCRGAHVVENRLALVGKTRGAVRHQALALGGANGLAEVGLARQAEFALAAFRGVQRDHMVTHSHRGHALAHRLNHRTAFMTED